MPRPSLAPQRGYCTANNFSPAPDMNQPLWSSVSHCWWSLYNKLKRSLLAVGLCSGKRRYDRKQSGYGGQTKPIFHKKVSCTTDNIVTPCINGYCDARRGSTNYFYLVKFAPVKYDKILCLFITAYYKHKLHATLLINKLKPQKGNKNRGKQTEKMIVGNIILIFNLK